jgi:putative membrane protein
MKLRLIRIGLVLAGNALGLLITSLLLGDDMDLSGAAFVIAVVIFTVLTLVLDPIVTSLAERYADVLAGGAALISTALALLLTEWLSDGLSIDGVGTWILAAVLVWVVTAIVGVVLGRVVMGRLGES